MSGRSGSGSGIGDRVAPSAARRGSATGSGDSPARRGIGSRDARAARIGDRARSPVRAHTLDSVSIGYPSRSERDLNNDERRQLLDAHAELRAAVAAYEPFLGTELRENEPVPTLPLQALRDAQQRVEAAEERLWTVRRELLGWSRPPWTPQASLVSDWFSDEDLVYDELTDLTRP